MLVIVAPGQGSQTSGFLKPWLELPTFASRLEELCQTTSLDLVHYGTEADDETIKDTKIAQPLLVVAGILSALEFVDINENLILAGHSVGEVTAAGLSGALSPEDAVRFVEVRGNEMAKASALEPTGMSAVIAGKEDEVLARIEECSLTPANYNGKGQIVAAGSMEGLQKLADNPPNRARVIPLKVAGAFHTAYMQPAADKLAEFAKTITPGQIKTKLLSNEDGSIVSDGQEYLDHLVTQVTAPVRWDLCMKTMTELGVTGLLELPPSKTMTGIAKRNMDVELFSLNTPDQLDEARAFCARHQG